MQEEKFVYTACPGWGDHDYCVIKTITKDGKIVRTEKVEYSEPELCDGHICQKGLTSGRQPYHPDRLLYPLKRKGERGEGKWEKISWDQALDEIATKLLDISERYGPESVVLWTLPAGVPPASGLGTLLSQRFGSLWGVTDPLISFGLDNGPFYTNFYNFGHGMGYLLIDPRNFIGADYIIVWGANPIENQMRITQNLVRARDAGAKIIDIGLIFDGTAGWVDEFVGVKAGSDGFIALAMARQILELGLEDRDFLINHTVAAYLVRDDDGRFYRDEIGNFAIWDTISGKAVAVTPQKGDIKADVPALEGNYVLEGSIHVKPAFQLLKEGLSEYTLDAAEKISGVSASRIAQITIEYASAKNAYLIGALGLRYANQGETYRAFDLLATITGNMGRPGAGVTTELIPISYPVVFNDLAITRPFGAQGNKTNPVRQGEFFEQVKRGDCPYKAFICPAGNPVHQFPNRSRWLGFVDKLELFVDIDIWLTDTGELADYVLPDAMPFERTELVCAAQYNHIVLQEPAIEPQGDVRSPTWYWTQLAKRLGLGEYFNKSEDEWLQIRLDTDYPPIASLEPKLTLERLRAEKMVRQNAPVEPKFDPFASLTFPTATGRIEFYFERLADIGFAVPRYLPCYESPVIDGNERFPYQLFTGRQRFFMQSMFTEDPITKELSGGGPATRMNPKDAVKEGLKNGDMVEVYNERGHVVAVLRTDEAVPPGTVHVWFGWRKRHFEKGTYSELMVPITDPSTVDALADHWWNDYVEAGNEIDCCLSSDAQLTGAWDTLWDVACAVRPYVVGKES
ncbi:MAG: molybdopterin-dependent oxidoreductase [Coriobacteriales bacterium]|jgi:molybdopterin-containing oxidoreductase family molybdopterin binding subunit|nr:molybdopterin-dependent oxidoreductase [Coriobacteriales bacterium]